MGLEMDMGQFGRALHFDRTSICRSSYLKWRSRLPRCGAGQLHPIRSSSCSSLDDLCASESPGARPSACAKSFREGIPVGRISCDQTGKDQIGHWEVALFWETESLVAVTRLLMAGGTNK